MRKTQLESHLLMLLAFFLLGLPIFASHPQPIRAATRTPSAIVCNPGEVKLKNNFLVTQNTIFCQGTYTVADRDNNGVIIVAADNVTIDGNHLTLDGRTKKGYGIYLNGHSGVTIKNFAIKNFYYAMRIENANTVSIENNNVSGNRVSDNTFLDINAPLASAQGGGILFNQVSTSLVRSNTGNNQDVGIDIYNSNNNTVENNDFSSNKAWGVRLYASGLNIISNNQAHHVNRCNNTGCDSAGILLVYGSHGNTIRGNNLTYSGDGFFIGNENGLPSNNNLIEGNDGSSSPNNAFETTFSQGNTFRNNIANNSNYGFWLGFSHDSRVEGNTISGNRTDSINVDHGRFITFSGNTISANGRYGIALTLSPNNPLVSRYPGSETSHDYTITGNTINDNIATGIYFQDTINSTMQNNKISGNQNGLYFTGGSTGNNASQNNLVCASTSKTCQYNAYNNMSSGNNLLAENNWWGTTDPLVIASLIYDGNDNPSLGLIDFDPFLTQPVP